MSSKVNKQRKVLGQAYLKLPAGKLEQTDLSAASFVPMGMTRAFKNNRVVVMVYDNTPIGNGFATKCLIQRVDGMPLPSHWKDMQAIKNELFGEETTGIEFYPKESKLMDDHNIYWLWIFPDGVIPEYNPYKP